VIGVEFADDEIARRLGVRGALVLKVGKNGPAAGAGMIGTTQEWPSGRIHLGDIVTGINDKAVGSTQDVYLALDDKQPKDKIVLQVLRGGQEKLSIPLQLGNNVE
jgi:S1-C subfamily serine protease